MFIPDGQVSISAQIDRKGFCEGEDISINAKFENTCSRIVVPKAAIIAKHSYIVDGRTKVTPLHVFPFQTSGTCDRKCELFRFLYTGVASEAVGSARKPHHFRDV